MKNNLIDNFIEFFIYIIKKFKIFPNLREKLFNIIKNIYKENYSKTSNILLNIYYYI